MYILCNLLRHHNSNWHSHHPATRRLRTTIRNLTRQLSIEKRRRVNAEKKVKALQQQLLDLQQQTPAPQDVKNSQDEQETLSENELDNSQQQVPQTPNTTHFNMSNLSTHSPRTNASQIISAMGVTPTKARMANVQVLCEAVAQIAHQPVSVKKKIYQDKSTKTYHGSATAISRAVGLCRNIIYKGEHPKSTTRQEIAKTKKEAVKEFLRREDNSYAMPDKRLNKEGKEQVVALTDTLRNLHLKFCTETSLQVSLALFCDVREKNKRSIKLCKFLKRRVCLCIYHANMGLMIESVCTLPNSTTALIQLSDEEIRESIQRVEKETLFYKIWETEKKEYTDPKTNEIKTTRRTELVKKQCTKVEMECMIMGALPAFRDHCARVDAQFSAITLLKEKLPPNHCTIQVDYSENWNAAYMKEIAKVFYGKAQVTIHPMVVNYWKRSEEGEMVLGSKAYAGISPVLSHKFSTTLTFIDLLIPQIEEHLLPRLEHVHVISDSPSSQYRNMHVCNFLRESLDMYNIKVTWNWLEAGHGKGPCDGVGGGLKTLADRLVKTSGAVQNAEDFMEQVSVETKKVHLLYAGEKEVEASKTLMKSWSKKPVHGLMKAHQATFHRGAIFIRPTSCYEECCLKENGQLLPVDKEWVRESHTQRKPVVEAFSYNYREEVSSSEDEDEMYDDEDSAYSSNMQHFSSEEEDQESSEEEHLPESRKKRKTRSAANSGEKKNDNTETSKQDVRKGKNMRKNKTQVKKPTKRSKRLEQKRKDNVDSDDNGVTFEALCDLYVKKRK